MPTVAVAGRCSLDEPSLRRAGFDAVYTLVDEAEHPDESFTDARAAATCHRGPHGRPPGRSRRMTVDQLFRARRAIVGEVETSAAVGVVARPDRRRRPA